RKLSLISTHSCLGTSNTDKSPRGFMGRIRSSRDNKWIARIKVDGKSKQLGLFSDIEKAKKVRLEGELKYWYK
ncbi:hypothetical protein CWO07_24165, partial [Vibrio splendidus]